MRAQASDKLSRKQEELEVRYRSRLRSRSPVRPPVVVSLMALIAELELIVHDTLLNSLS